MTAGNGHAAPQPGYELAPVEDFLTAIAAPEYLVDGLLEERSVAGIVAPPESGKSLLALELAVCVAMGFPFHGRAVRRGLVVYLAGEGQHGLAARLQALATRHPIANDTDIVPLRIARSATSLIDPLEYLKVQAAIDAEVERYQMPLSLLVIDTLSRFMGGDESKAQDMGAYLNAVDGLRAGAAAVTLHHPGHGDATRGRGSSSWRGALDTEYLLAKNTDNVVTVTCQKMKDGPKPAPFSFSIVQAPTRMTREDGTPVHSALLVPTDTVRMTKPQLKGKNQKTLLAHLSNQPAGAIWAENDFSSLGKDVGLNRWQLRDALLGLRQMGYLEMTVGGSRLRV